MKIVNIVATVVLTSTLDLNKLHEILQNSRFSKKNASWLQYRLQPENYYTTFYKSGKFLITGVSSLKKVESIANRIIAILKKNQLNVKIEKIRIHNIVVIDSFQTEINIEKLLIALRDENIEYEPEQFPGLILREKQHSFLIFKSGKIILTGINDINKIRPALNSLKNKIRKLQN
jgi:transcription initiation factor TFIID TATA-box-binding protein